MASRPGEDVRVVIDRVKPRIRIHVDEQSGRTDARSGPELEETPAGLRRRKRPQQCAGSGFGPHRESEFLALHVNGVDRAATIGPSNQTMSRASRTVRFTMTVR